MLILIAGLALFVASHLVPTRPALRAGLVARMGQGGYMALFSVVSLASLVLIVVGYGQFSTASSQINPQLWSPPSWTRHIAYLLMAASMILLVAAYVPSRIRDVAQHPMLAAVKLWALAHLLVRGDLAALVLFGTFLAWAIYDRISVKRRGGGRGPLGNATGAARGDIIAVVGGLVLFGAMLAFGHKALIGVALLR
jgi:uncharacterized membrane protein